MAEYFSTGSAIERALICAPSVILPHARFESEYTTRGSEIHAFLEACSKIGREAALEQTPEEWREACAELNLDGLHAQLSLAAEVALAYNCVTDTARELGRGAGRIYDDVTEDEIPCTLDVIGVRDLPNGKRRGLYTDWKSGFRNRRSISLVTQIDFGALCVARAFDCNIVEGQLINVHEDFAPYVQRKILEEWELDAFASELREQHAEWRRLRSAWRAGVIPRDFDTGPWCERCPAREFCPAQTTMLRSVLGKEIFDGMLRMEPIPDASLADAWNQLHSAQSVLSLVKSKIMGVASTRKIFLGTLPDGSERWIGPVIDEGNEKLDGEIVFDVVAELHGEEAASAATKVTATKKDLKAAIKAAVPRGQAAKSLATVLARVKDAGGIARKINFAPKEFTVKPPALDGGSMALREADRRLTNGIGEAYGEAEDVASSAQDGQPNENQPSGSDDLHEP